MVKMIVVSHVVYIYFLKYQWFFGAN